MEAMRSLTPTISRLGILSLVAMLSFFHPLPAEEDRLLIRWLFEEDGGDTVTDVSGNGLDGVLGGERIDTPTGRGVYLDGVSSSIIHVDLPENQRFGKDSWSFTAWIKPTRFSIDAAQNERRLFSFGVYPDANLVLNLSGNGDFTSYFCYRDEDGNIRATGASAPLRLELDQWAHVAAVTDREDGKIHLFINGVTGHGHAFPENFDGDFSLGSRLTVGSSWQNYQGGIDRVSLYRRALSRDEVRAEFTAGRETFEVELSPVLQREEVAATLSNIAAAWRAGDFEKARAMLAEPLNDASIPAHYRSQVHLRIAQSHAAEGNLEAARAEYRAIADNQAYPEVHRYEASERARELEREARGLPAHDPALSRTDIPVIESFAAEVFVSPDGNDDHDGSRGRPFATLSRARDEVRELKATGVGGAIAVTFLPGTYPMLKTLELTSQDSGTEGAPVVYRAEEMGQATLYGGARLSGFVPVTDPAILDRLPANSRGKVYQTDLSGQGIEDYGELRVRGFGQPPAPPTLELYFDGQPMTLARWPNEGFVEIRELLEPGSREQGTPSVIGYLDDRHERWTQAEDPWLFGYFHFLWADATARIEHIDTEKKTITTSEPYDYGGRGMANEQGIIYYAFNLLEEIERPGEWYLNRDTGILYFYPPSDPEHATIEIGVLDSPMITMDGVTDVRLEGLVFDLARHNGIVITNSFRCLVAGSTVQRMAGNGISIHGGRENGIFGCHIHTIGRRATEVIGGVRATLEPGRHFVENCRIHDFGRIDRTYTPAIQLEGVGNRVAHNLMFNGPSSVMRIEGNDHLVEFNDIRDAVTESDDQGAIDMFRNATYRGGVFRYNSFRDIGKTGDEPAVHGQAAVRFDDAISGMLVYGNLFVRSSNGNFGAVQMNSGRDNIMDNNIFIDNARGVSGGWNRNNHVWRMLRENPEQAGFFTNDLYLERYPEIAGMLEDPAVNHVWRNLFIRCGQITTGNLANLDLLQNAEFDADPGFVGPDDYRLRPDSPVFEQIGFRNLPLDQAGLYDHPLRASAEEPNR
jgi:hypothetical protein